MALRWPRQCGSMMKRVRGARGAYAAVLAALACVVAPAAATELKPCRLKGVVHEALCGMLSRPLDLQRPDAQRIDVHYAVLPALARNKLPDPVFFFAGGPGQSAVELAGPIAAQLSRFANRRDIVLIDQRGTGRSAPLSCDEKADAMRPLAEQLDADAQVRRLQACARRLSQLPHGDLRHYTTTEAMADADAVRQALGAPRINLMGVSYGTRAALEYLRLFPSAVRRVVLDGVAPADMVLPLAFSTDNQAALDGWLQWCAQDKACRDQHPALAKQWAALLASLPLEVAMAHPVTGREERVMLTRDALVGMVRTALYVPAFAAALPQAIAEAAAGRFGALAGLASALSSNTSQLYAGMHFSVVCAEDEPRRARSADVPGVDFGTAFARLYEQACAAWPRGAVDTAFYTTPTTHVATLLLSGGDDPATPPRHAARVAAALGPKARHVVVAHGGHGVAALPCMREAVYRFVDAASDDAALGMALDCARQVPRPPLFVPVAAAAAASGPAR